MSHYRAPRPSAPPPAGPPEVSPADEVAVSAAVDFLDAVRVRNFEFAGGIGYVYYASETREHLVVSYYGMVDLGQRLIEKDYAGLDINNRDSESRRYDAYSLWCQDHGEDASEDEIAQYDASARSLSPLPTRDDP